MCLFSKSISHKVFLSHCLASFISNNIKNIFDIEEIVENLLLLIDNLSKFFNNNQENYLKFLNQNDLDGGIIFFYFLNQTILEQELNNILSENNILVLLSGLNNILSISSMKSFFDKMYQDEKKFSTLSKFIIKGFYNNNFVNYSINIIMKLITYTPVEEFFQIDPVRFCHAVVYVLKMTKNSDIKSNIYFSLSNLVLNYRCLRIFIQNPSLLEYAGIDFIKSSNDVRKEIAMFFGNVCFQIEPDLVKNILENKILEILKIGFDFENEEIITIIIKSFCLFFKKFSDFQEDLEENELNLISEFANEEDFIEKLEYFENKYYQKSNNINQNQGLYYEIINNIYNLKSMIGLN